MQVNRRARWWWRLLGTGLGLWLGLGAVPGGAQLVWKSADETASVKLGLLAQLQGETVGAAGDEQARNLFLRRARLLLGFTFGERLSVFVETDSPNLGKADATGTKNAGDLYLQDVVVTWRFADALHLDGGLLLPVTSYNHGQSAASLLAADYGPYSFLESAPLEARVGRDYGLQARGYLADRHLEYRVGVFQGRRGPGATNGLRTTARLMYSFFTPQTGLFYRGTSFGRTKTVAIGASWDAQESFSSRGADLFVELPLGGDGLTLQADAVRYDGGRFLAGLPPQETLLLEAGYYFGSVRLQPFAQYARRDFVRSAAGDEKRLAAGCGWYFRGHEQNLKVSFARVEPAGGPRRDEIVLQWQLFAF